MNFLKKIRSAGTLLGREEGPEWDRGRLHRVIDTLMGENASLRKELQTMSAAALKYEDPPILQKVLVKDPVSAETVLRAIAAERERQEKKWGQQNWPLGVKVNEFSAEVEKVYRWAYENTPKEKRTWSLILSEEIAEFYNSPEESQQIEELVQIAAVCAAAAESLLRKKRFQLT